MNQKSSVIEVLSDDMELRPIEDCVTPKMKELLEQMSSETRNLALSELESRLTITPVLGQLKMNFWKEYDRTLALDKKAMELYLVYSGVCTKQYFFSYVMHREEMLAWLFHPPTNYETATEEALTYGLPKIRKILDAPIFKVKEDGTEGEFINANAASVLSAMKFLDSRVKGSPLQRIEQKSLHVHRNADGPKGVSREEMQQELEALNQRLGGGTLQLKAPNETE